VHELSTRLSGNTEFGLYRLERRAVFLLKLPAVLFCASNLALRNNILRLD